MEGKFCSPLFCRKSDDLLPMYQVAKGKLRTLDFKRIKDAERDHARSLFVDEETGLPTKLALSLTSDASIAAQSATAAVSTESTGQDASKGRLMTAEDKTKIREAIQKAENIEEIRKLERMLAEGRMPAGEKA
jgi:U2 small nuclear ribonucleoprotein A'